MTETGMSLGTPHYMSPEQAMGEREITARTDVYALGCVIYEMLIGEPPFTGPHRAGHRRQGDDREAARLIAVRRTRVPAAVEDAVLTALAKLPADRFASAAEFAAALRESGRTSRATTATSLASGGPVARWTVRSLLPWALAAGLAGAGAVELVMPAHARRDASPGSRYAPPRYPVRVSD